MTPHYSDAWLDIYQGDVRDVLPTLPADSVDCIVTSPPYWGLRDYGTAAWVGGDAECDHQYTKRQNLDQLGERYAGGGHKAKDATIPYAHSCPRCGAIRQDSQLGLERTPEEYVANLVAVFRELRRVLKPSGTCWLNLGDSYASGEIGRHDGYNPTRENGTTTRKPFGERQQGKPATGLKPKDLVGIPWRVAFALQADGWYLRSDIIWAKPNPMPESVTDRPTKAHEYVFLLTKGARYYFDADAVREGYAPSTLERDAASPNTHAGIGQSRKAQAVRGDGGAAVYRAKLGTYEAEADPDNPHSARRGPKQNFDVPANGRNLRSVWTIATRPYPGAHFAVFPPELPERCIKAGSPSGGLVLDPFAGSGTVGLVANRLSRRAILVDLNADYLKQQLQRNAQTPLGLGV